VIDPTSEELVPVMDARPLFPRVRLLNAADPSSRTLIAYATIIKLCTQGDRRGVRLESVMVSGVRHTSREAIARFLRAASVAEDENLGPRRKPLRGAS
jgi:hypothetical protein